jgi:hypothetical protein
MSQLLGRKARIELQSGYRLNHCIILCNKNLIHHSYYYDKNKSWHGCGDDRKELSVDRINALQEAKWQL